MKNLKFILVMLLICSMVLPLTACPDDGGDDDWGNTGGGNNKGKTLTIVCYEGGFGSAWLTELAKQFETAYDCKVVVKHSYINGELCLSLGGALLLYLWRSKGYLCRKQRLRSFPSQGALRLSF